MGTMWLFTQVARVRREMPSLSANCTCVSNCSGAAETSGGQSDAERGVWVCGRVGVDFIVVCVVIVLGSLFSVVMGATIWFSLVASVRARGMEMPEERGGCVRAVGGGLAAVGGVSNSGGCEARVLHCRFALNSAGGRVLHVSSPSGLRTRRSLTLTHNFKN